MAWYSQRAERKRKIFQPRLRYLVKLLFRIEGEVKSFPEKQKLKKFITIKQALQEMSKGLL